LETGVTKSSQSSMKEDVWYKICHFREKSLRKKVVLEEPELPKVGVLDFI